MNIPLVEKNSKSEEVFEASGTFFSGTATKISFIDSINESVFSTPWENYVSTIAQEAYQNIVMDRNYSYVIV